MANPATQAGLPAETSSTTVDEQTFDAIPDANLYVKNLDDDVDDDRLKEIFGMYGTIVSVKAMMDESTGRARGFGFVCFSSAEEAARAKNALNGQMIGSKPLYINIAQKKEERRALLSKQYGQLFDADRESSSPVGSIPARQPPTQNHISTAPRTRASPQMPNPVFIPGGASRSSQPSPRMTQQFGGMNSFVLIHPPVGQSPVTPAGYYFAPVSQMTQPPLQPGYRPTPVGLPHWPASMYSAVATNPGQNHVTGVRYPHVHAATPPSPSILSLGPGAIRPMPLPVPLGVAHPPTVNLNTIPNVPVHHMHNGGVGTFPSQSHSHTRWAQRNGNS